MARQDEVRKHWVCKHTWGRPPLLRPHSVLLLRGCGQYLPQAPLQLRQGAAPSRVPLLLCCAASRTAGGAAVRTLAAASRACCWRAVHPAVLVAMRVGRDWQPARCAKVGCGGCKVQRSWQEWQDQVGHRQLVVCVAAAASSHTLYATAPLHMADEKQWRGRLRLGDAQQRSLGRRRGQNSCQRRHSVL